MSPFVSGIGSVNSFSTKLVDFASTCKPECGSFRLLSAWANA